MLAKTQVTLIYFHLQILIKNVEVNFFIHSFLKYLSNVPVPLFNVPPADFPFVMAIWGDIQNHFTSKHDMCNDQTDFLFYFFQIFFSKLQTSFNSFFFICGVLSHQSALEMSDHFVFP